MMIGGKVKVNRPLDQVKKEGRKRLFFGLKLVALFFALIWKWRNNDAFEDLHIESSLISAIFYYLTSVLIVSFGRISLVFLYLRRRHKESDFKDNFILGINRIASILYVIILLISILYYFNIEIKEFFTSISIVAAAIAIISKDYLVNMINGFILMFSNQLSLNDYIKVGELSGRILDITLLNIVLLSDEDEVVYIPNTLVATSNVVNSTKKNFKKLSFDFELSPEVLGNPDELEDYIIDALKVEFKDLSLEKFSLKIIEIKRDFVNLKLHITLDKRHKDLEKPVRRFINKTILNYITENKDLKA
ncbi:MAG: Mechanosensitive ion channel [Cytophagales bacterium CG12_big_fil_rev_8_21_14_0_65_40_12]|nr:MAG: Mechanosensitive ion channel [Cytophagales bacterium CG12_big_fil_rev_8_21_14_0_65_40_12]PIW04357.1 MAG: Mechanosensitive ion channel [Cytophagales bacterium CG17_big_fil_post_rev_8_21_14_2_50_40_13]